MLALLGMQQTTNDNQTMAQHQNDDGDHVLDQHSYSNDTTADDDRYFKMNSNDSETETMTPPSARSTVYSLEQEFNYEAAVTEGTDAGQEGNGYNGEEEEDDDLNLPPPPPPREDYEDDDGEDSSMEDHISRDHRNNNDNDNDDNNDNNIDDNDNDDNMSNLNSTIDNSTLFDGLSCGDETMHVLMDAEARLRTIPPSSMKKPSEHRLTPVGEGMAGRTSLHLQRHNDFETRQQHFENQRQAKENQQQHQQEVQRQNIFEMRAGDNNNNPDNSMLTDGTFDDNLSTGLSTGVASLLRGPIMAAKSTRANAKLNHGMEGMSISNNGDSNVAGTNDGGGMDEFGNNVIGGNNSNDDDTPSKARNEFLYSSRKNPFPSQNHAATPSTVRNGFMEHSNPMTHHNQAGATPSTARNEYRAAATPSTVRNEFMAETATTPSTVRNEFITENNTPSANRSPAEGTAKTPSAARKEFLSSTKKNPRPQSVESAHRSPVGYDNGMMIGQGMYAQSGAGSGSTPSLIRREFVVSTQKPSRQRPPLQQLLHSQTSQLSPSTARENFLISPQDSVSTIGNRSPSEAYLTMQQMLQQHETESQQQQQEQPTPSTQRRLAISPQSSVHSLPSVAGASPVSMAKYALETPLSTGSGDDGGGAGSGTSGSSPTLEKDVNQFMDGGMEQYNNSMMPQSNGKANPSNNNASSLESIIARGEEQMRIAAATAAAAASNTPGLPPKKPFLRKGARKEPSSLHKMSGPSSAVTPSTQQRSNGNNTPANNHHVSHTPSNAKSTASNGANETLSERKVRLARLERMQEDLMKDLDRRQVRKEEARKDREALKKQQKQNKLLERQKQSVMKTGNNTAATPATPVVSTRNAITPSQARARSVPKRRIVGGKGVVEMTPSQIRDSVSGKPPLSRQASFDDGIEPVEVEDNLTTPSHARQNSSMTPSQVRALSVVKRSTSNVASNNENITPSQARRMSSDSETAPSNDKSDHHQDYDEFNDNFAEEYDASLAENMCAEEREVSDFEEIERLANEEVHEENNKPKSARKEPRSKSTPRPRTSSQPPRATSATKRRIGLSGKAKNNCVRRSPRTGSKLNNAQSSALSNEDDKKAFEDWKRKEEEQWALIKNMRRRQEAALREAEGERERAKAWAAAEKETVEKWAKEQRAMIKKDRHKAANAALIASKKANKEDQRNRDGNAEEETEALQLELEELRAKMKKTRLEAGEETKRLKEHIRRQERTISSLRGSKGPVNKEGETRNQSRSPASGAAGGPPRHKSPAGGSGRGRGHRQALGDRSSKQNAQQQHPQGSRPKTQQRRKSSENGRAEASNVKEIDVEQEPVQAEEQEGDDEVVDTLTEEPTEHWLQRHLSQLSNANNRLGEKMMDEGNISNQQQQFGQRKPYNAANYGGKQEDTQYPTQSLSRPNGFHSDSVPQEVVTALSPVVRPSGTITSRTDDVDSADDHGSHNQPDNHHQQAQQQGTTKSQMFTYKNGTEKEVLPDGTTTVSFANGDRKRTYANEKKGIVVYYYAATKTTQVTHQDGMQTYHFPNKQIENHYSDGRKEITFPDGTVRMVHMDDVCETTFPDGVRVVDYPDGTQRVMP